MAIRNIRKYPDPVLEKECKAVDKMTERTQILIEDMLDTMYDAGGVGLAAPQVGILKQICVVDISENCDEPYVLINPVIVESDGEQTGDEGCLSLPGKQGTVTRPDHVVVKAFNEELEEITVEGTGLLARAFCHEIDHLHGHMYMEKVEGDLKSTRSSDNEEDA
ncbi:MAG: peptide deformylase [Lachnospiraceae bacterium]|nr:peptide deformylase [Lachnospiraceae bacterium]